MKCRCECGEMVEGAGEMCRRCRGRKFGQARRKYKFTVELREELRRVYTGNKREITDGLSRLVARTRWPRHAFKYEAIRLGIVTNDHRRAWLRDEIEYLSERIGTVKVTTIAKHLRRSVESCIAKVERLHLSRRPREGYNAADLALAFGVHHQVISRWMDRGLFGRVSRNGGKRVAETSVMRFLRRHVHEYDLRRVDQVWFKSMIFEGRNVED